MIHNDIRQKKAAMPRVIRTSSKIFRIICLGVTMCVLNTSMASAIETTKASGLFLEERKGLTPSHTQNSPLSRNAKQGNSSSSTSSCLTFLSLNAAPSSIAKHRNDAGSQVRHRASSGTAAVPVALGLFFGARLALGPQKTNKKITSFSNRFKIGPEIRKVSRDANNSYALAVAAYRKCEKEGFLKAHP